MDKLKNVLSHHGSKKEAHGEGSHLHAGRQTQGTGADANEYHPIYDQFASQSSAQPGDSSNTTPKDFFRSGRQDESASSSIRPDTTLGPRGNMTDETSTASIKSGIMGHPQTGNILPDRTVPSQQHGSSQLGKDAALGTGALGAGHSLHRQPDHDDLRAPVQSSTREFQPYDRSLEEPVLATDTDRSFPLAGGVTSTKQAEHHPIATSDRELGSKERNTALSGNNNHGREALAGAAAAATAGSASSDALGSEHQTQSENLDRQQPGYLDQAKQAAGNVATTVTSTASTALAGAQAAWSGQRGSKDPYDPCADSNESSANFVPGPHRTDTANRIDPKLHIPGEFPETPMETPGDRPRDEYLPGTTSTRTAGTNMQSDDTLAPHTGLTDTHMGHREPRDGNHGVGKAAGLGAAGLGAAGVGAYAAGKHHQHDSADIETATTNNPYSAKGIDSRVNPHSKPLEEQRFDPTAQTKPSPHATGHGLTSQSNPSHQTSRVQDERREKDHHYGRDAGLIGAGAATAGGLYAAGHRDDKHDSAPYTAAQGTGPTATSGVSSTPQYGTTQPSSKLQDEPLHKDHHHGRDAGLIGAGAATAGGLYGASHHDDQSKSTPVATGNEPGLTGASGTTATHQQNRAAQPGFTGASGTTAIPQQQNTTQQIPQTRDDSHEKDHHYGRNAGLAGAGAAAAGGLYYANQRDEKQDTGPASATIGPHKSNVANVVDPRVQPDPALQNKHTTTGPHQSDMLNRLDPRVDSKAQTGDHHGSGQGALAGAALGGNHPHQAEHGYGENRNIQPTTSMDDQRYDPTARHAHDSTESGHHHGRDAALAAGAGGLAYGAHKKEHDSGEPTTSHRDSASRDPQSLTSESTTTHGSHGSHVPAAIHNYPPENYPSYNYPPEKYPAKNHPRVAEAARGPDYDPRRGSQEGERVEEHHHGRDAGMAAGAGALAAGAHSHHKEHEKSQGYTGNKLDDTWPHEHMHQTENASAREPHETRQSSHIPVAAQIPTQDQHRGDHHYGRDAGLAAGAGAAGAGLYAASKHNDTDAQHGSHVAQPPVAHSSSTQHQPQQSSQIPVSSQYSHQEHNRPDHHYGRDAGLAAGAGAAGAGLYGASKHHDNASQQPHTSELMSSQADQPLSPRSTVPQQYGTTHGSGVTGNTHTGSGLTGNSHGSDPTGPHDSRTANKMDPRVDSDRNTGHHYGRDAGLAAGAGAAGAGLYGASKHHDSTQQPMSSQQPYSSHQPTTQMSGTQQPLSHQGYDSKAPVNDQMTHPQESNTNQSQEQDHHYGRNAGLAAGAGALGAGAYAHHQGQDSEKERLAREKAEQKELEHQRKAEEKELAHQQKQEQHALAAQQKAAEKQAAHDQKKHDKALAHEEASRQREIERENARQEKEAERVASHESGKSEGSGKKHLFGFLHRDKSKSPEASPRNSTEETTGRRSLEGRNKLHKDPPPGHPAWQVQNNGPQHLGADGRPDDVSRDDHLHSGVYEAPHPNDQGRFVTDPNTGVAQHLDREGTGHYGASTRDEGAEGNRHGLGA